MMVMTAKVNKKKIALVLAGIALLVAAMIMLFGGEGEAAATGAPALSTNDGRVQFLTDFGWDVAASPVESGQVKIPDTSDEVFSRYNTLQKSQGYDLSQYAGKSVMRYVYKIRNYPGATDPVYATLLVYKDQVIGGDITDTSARGVIRGFKMPTAATPVPQPEAGSSES
jgi:hypothetical protein